MSKAKFPDFLDQDVDTVARKLLGCILESKNGDETVRVRIVETESYDENDEASHAFGGKRNRNDTMFGSPGLLYVYFTYGLHHCCNIVTGREGYGSGVLIRAVEPLTGQDIIEKRRGMTGVNITNGPGKVCVALGIDLSMKGHDLHSPPLKLFVASLGKNENITTTTRIGISKAKDLHRRFYITGNPYVSKPRLPEKNIS